MSKEGKRIKKIRLSSNAKGQSENGSVSTIVTLVSSSSDFVRERKKGTKSTMRVRKKKKKEKGQKEKVGRAKVNQKLNTRKTDTI